MNDIDLISFRHQAYTDAYNQLMNEYSMTPAAQRPNSPPSAEEVRIRAESILAFMMGN